MSATNTGAKFKFNLRGNTEGILKSYIIKNSSTITIGDYVKLDAGFIDLAGANTPILGVVRGLTDNLGIDLQNTKVVLDGTFTAPHTYAAASDNATDKQIRAIVDIDPMSVYSLEPDNTIGTTDSDLAGNYMDIIADSDEGDEDTTTTTQMQLFIWGVDPEDSTRALVSIAEHQIWGA